MMFSTSTQVIICCCGSECKHKAKKKKKKTKPMFLCVRSLGWTAFLETCEFCYLFWLSPGFPQSLQREALPWEKKNKKKTNILIRAVASAYNLKLSRATSEMTQGDTVSKEYQNRAVINSTKPQLEAHLLLSNTETLLFLTTLSVCKKARSP